MAGRESLEEALSVAESSSLRLEAVQDLLCAYAAALRYDGLGRRIWKIDKTGQSDVTYDYYYNASWQILEVRINGDTDPHKQCVWDIRYIDAPVLRWRDGDASTAPDNEVDDTLYYLTDANMNVTALVDTSGTVQERYTYDPYGKVTIRNPTTWAEIAWNASKKNEILYCGYREDFRHSSIGESVLLRRDPL